MAQTFDWKLVEEKIAGDLYLLTLSRFTFFKRLKVSESLASQSNYNFINQVSIIVII